MNHILFKSFILLLFSLHLFAATPTTSKIKQWLGKRNIEIDTLKRIYLQDNERAFIAKIIFLDDDTIIKETLALIRPELDEAEFIPTFALKYKVMDLNHDGISEIIFSNTISNVSNDITTLSIIEFHDYEINILFSTSFTTQKACHLCVQEHISWKFRDTNKDKIKDLIQVYELTLNTKADSIIIAEEEEVFLFQNAKFTRPKKTKTLSAMQLSYEVINREAINVSDTFYLTDKELSCFLDFKEVTKDEQIHYLWFHEEQGLVLDRVQDIHPAKRYRTWMRKSIKQKKSYLGKWVVVVSDAKKKLLGSSQFTILAPEILKDLNTTVIQDVNNSNQVGTKHL